ncbi:MAG: hypothetical protein ABSF64_36890 [Bryobacteraceae bacterium]|jgi:hypothetical protein
METGNLAADNASSPIRTLAVAETGLLAPGAGGVSRVGYRAPSSSVSHASVVKRQPMAPALRAALSASHAPALHGPRPPAVRLGRGTGAVAGLTQIEFTVPDSGQHQLHWSAQSPLFQGRGSLATYIAPQ